MRSLLFATLVGLTAISPAQAAKTKTTSAKAWVRDCMAFFTPRTGPQDEDKSEASFEALLQQLPPPAEWPQLHTLLQAELARVPAGDPRRRQQVQAADWLVLYLLDDRKAILAALPKDPTMDGESRDESVDLSDPVIGTQIQLRQALDNKSAEATPIQVLLESARQQLDYLEPVTEETVRKILGSDEEFARLQRIRQSVVEFREKYVQLLKDYKATQDRAATEAKMTALQQDYQARYGAEQEALEKHLRNPTIRHFLDQSMPSGAQEDPYVPVLHFPNFLDSPLEAAGRELLKRALRKPVRISFASQATPALRTLARNEALAALAEMKAPSWELTHDLEGGPLFKALLERFPPADGNDYEFDTARAYELARLIIAGQTAAAVQFASDPKAKLSLSYSLTETLEQHHAAEYWDYLHARLSANPNSDEWDAFNRLSATLGREKELKRLMAEKIAAQAFTGQTSLEVRKKQALTLLAADDLPAAVTQLRALVQSPGATGPQRRHQSEIAATLMELADLQEDAAGFATALAAAESLVDLTQEADEEEMMQTSEQVPEELKAQLRKRAEQTRAYAFVGNTANLTTTLTKLRRHGDTVRIARAFWLRVAGVEKRRQPGGDEETGGIADQSWQVNSILSNQLLAETEQGHWREAAALLQDNPWWEKADLAGLLNQTAGEPDRPIGYFAARVARQQGDTALARRLLEAQLARQPACDALYAEYLDLAGARAMPLLEKLAATDRYQERPLIWKARRQLDEKKTKAAIATLEEAIAIDPSDGEEGRGDRMRVYAFMGEAQAARGDKEKAAFFGNVVKAIRLSETADRWYKLGAYSRAIRLYREALGFFADAYCIQSRLAVQLAKQGRMDEAAEHYRKAFELMPDSFGRVESHCFGCEHVFQGEQPQGLAEETFARMLKARPDKPQLHYLSGYLEQERDRIEAAVAHYRRAVALDPLYLNAWKKLAELADRAALDRAERDRLAFKLIELDPGQRHDRPDFQAISDLAGLWKALAGARAQLAALPQPATLWPLKAAAARLAGQRESRFSREDEALGGPDFHRVLMDHHRFVQELGSYLELLSAPPSQPDGEVPEDKPMAG